MIQIVYEQALGPEFSEHYDLIVAQTDAEKGRIYDLRCRSAFAASPNRGIDSFDARAHHLCLVHRQSERVVAATRLIPALNSAGGGGICLPIEHRLQPEVRQSGLYLPTHVQNALAGEMVLSELSQIHLLSERDGAELDLLPGEVLVQALTLSAFALARLLFHDVMLCELSLEHFKRFRSRGLQFEYASALAEEDAGKAVFYLEVNQEIRASSPYYSTFQHLSEGIAPQLNMPDLLDSALES